MEHSLGKMEGNIMVNIKMTKKKGMDCSNGLMEKNIEENGKMENSMEMVNIIIQI